jgi:hypothetical protein
MKHIKCEVEVPGCNAVFHGECVTCWKNVLTLSPGPGG